MKPRAIMVCVDYSDALSLSIPWNAHHFSEIVVVTSHADAANVYNAVPPLFRIGGTITRLNGEVETIPRFRVYVTDAFFAHGALFNKWAALEEALEVYGRHGVIAIMDADVLWPKDAKLPPIECGKLYSPRRRMFPTVPASIAEVPPESEWSRYPLFDESEFAGYTQVFHADDPSLGPAPWHETNWTHAGGADSFFQMKWSRENKIRPAWDCLHLGEPGHNWCGRATPFADGTRHPDAPQRLGELAKLMTIRNMVQGFDHEKI